MLQTCDDPEEAIRSGVLYHLWWAGENHHTARHPSMCRINQTGPHTVSETLIEPIEHWWRPHHRDGHLTEYLGQTTLAIWFGPARHYMRVIEREQLHTRDVFADTPTLEKLCDAAWQTLRQ